MKKVYAISDNIFSPLGLDSEANWNALLQGKSGVEPRNKPSIQLKDFHAAVFQANIIEESFAAIASPAEFTKLEQMYILSILDAVQRTDVDARSARTLFLFSTTKGNIDLLENNSIDKYKADRISLSVMAKQVTQYFGNPNEPVVLSNACISGVLALIIGSYYIREGQYDHVIVSGGDIISEFTVSGFQCLHALSADYCKPFDKNRTGINLGEACATVVLSAQAQASTDIELKGGATSNDANHISGPSKTGDGLFQAISHSLNYSGFLPQDIGYVSAHGTATSYNDEMEAKALHLASLSEVPVNSLKGYFGHTLGAAGVLETILATWALKKQTVIASRGYSDHGVSLPLAVIEKNTAISFHNCLKTASGFGGCNVALILSKNY
ncbi:MAG: beta-ketoacyl synthase N-terminal-like domain-containing protein [Bacteroidota bacterium]